MPDKSILVTKENGICSITLNRPEVLNAYNGAIGTGLMNALNDIAGDRKVRDSRLLGEDCERRKEKDAEDAVCEVPVHCSSGGFG